MNPTPKKAGTLSHYEALVEKAVRAIAGHLGEALDLAALAAPACMAPLHFHRVFRGLVGETPLQLHRRLRLERAAWQLANDPQIAVLRVALEAGYDTHESFTRAFRDAFGRSPSEYRNPPDGRRPSHRLQAACSLHADGGKIIWPADRRTLFIHHGVRNMHVEIEICPQRRAAALSHRGPYNTIGESFERLGGIAGPAGLFADPQARMIAIYRDDPETVPAAQLRSAAGILVSDNAKVPAPLEEIVLPAGPWAWCLHRGSYAALGDAWQQLIGQWLPRSGRRMAAGDCFELYLNHPGQVPEDQLMTRLYVPLEDEPD